MTEELGEPKSCYNCQYFPLCRVRDRASDLVSYVNSTGLQLTNKFPWALYELMGSLCNEYKQEEVEEKE